MRVDHGNTTASPEREYSALTAIPSAGTPDPLDLFTHEGRVFSVTRRILGRSPTRVPREQVEVIARQLWDVVAISHEAGWVHCDIRPENIIIDGSGTASLVDWESATRVGGHCGPGTLGYSPHSAWSGSSVADPANDFYSLAVTIWELWNGRRAFVGTREKILQDQSTFSFQCDGGLSECVKALFEAAKDARIPHGRPDELRSDGRSPVDAARLVRALARGRVGTTASTAIAVVGDGGLLLLQASGHTHSESRIIASALADELRVRWSRSSLPIEAAASFATLQLTSVHRQNDVSPSRSDQVRAQRAYSGALWNAICEMAKSTVIVCQDSHPLSVLLRDEIERRQTQSGRALQNVVSPPIAESQFRLTEDGRRELLLDAAKIGLPASTIVEAKTLAVERRKMSIEQVVRRADTAHRRRTSHERWGAAAITEGQRPRLKKHQPRSLTSDGPYDNRVRMTIASLLLAGENAAGAGRTGDVFRICVRIHTTLATDERAAIEDLLRLADLWIECARGDAAEVILRSIPDADHRAEVVSRLGRVLCSRADLEGLRSLVATGAQLPFSQELAPEMDRLTAIIALHDGDRQTAYRLVRRARRRARGVGEVTAIWIAITTGNVLRSLGRAWSARRVLAIARRRAAAIGGVRLAIVAGGNLLQVPLPGYSPGLRAHDAAELATECRKWGMTAEWATLTATAAALAIVAHEPRLAVQLTEAVRRDLGKSAYLAPSIARLIARRWRDAVDLAEAWAEIEGIAVGEADPADPSTVVHRALIRLELGLDQLENAMFSAEGATRSDTWESVRLLLRTTCDAAEFQLRLQSIADQVAAESPMVGHVARALVRAELARGEGGKLLEVFSGGASKDSTITALSDAVRVLLACYGPPIGAATLRRLGAERSAHEWARPPGVRRWEWHTWLAQLAHAGAIDGGDSHTVETAIGLAEDAVAGLSEQCRLEYSRGLPFATWKRCVGLSDVTLPDLFHIGRAVEPLTVFRAWLGRNGATGAREHARMVGLERVVQNALRLRATADVDTVLRQVALGVLEVVRAERAVVIYDQASGPGLAVVATGNGQIIRDTVSAAEVSSSAIERARSSGRACIVDDACGDGELGTRPSVRQYRARSLVVAPLRVGGRTLGHVYVENRSTPRSFSASDAEIIEGFAAQAALALENSQLVSELRSTCDTLREARSEAIRQESLRVIGRMASEVAHDLNNLLTAILGEAQLLLQGSVSQDTRQSLEVIQRAVLDGNSIVARIQGSTKAPVVERTEGMRVQKLVEEVSEAIRLSAAARGVSIETRLARVGRVVRGVGAELREVLTNIAVNAVDASDAGGVVSIVLECADEHAEIRVEDRGCGMSAETVARAFDPFFTTKGAAGNGLGLSIAKDIVERHGGRIHIASALERGTTVRIELPYDSGHSSVDARSHVDANAAILVLSEEPTVSRALLLSLNSIGCAAESVNLGAADFGQACAEMSRVSNAIIDLGAASAERMNIVNAAVAALGRDKVLIMSTAIRDSDLTRIAKQIGVRSLRTPISRARLKGVLGVS